MELKHSGLGISSFVISLLSGFAAFVLVAIAGVMEATTPGGIDEKSADAIMLGLFIILCVFISVIALGLGIAGLFQKERNKLFAIIGIVINSMVITGILLLIVIGNMSG